MDKVKKSDLKDAPKILVGNKLDLENKNLGIVRDKDGKDYANEYKMKFIKTSASEPRNVKEAFILLVKEILEKRNNPQKEEIKTEDMLKNNTKKNNHVVVVIKN